MTALTKKYVDNCFACGNEEANEWMNWGLDICKACKAVTPLDFLHKYLLAEITKDELRKIVISARLIAAKRGITLILEGDGYEDFVLNTELIEFSDMKIKDKNGTDIAKLYAGGWMINPLFSQGIVLPDRYEIMVITNG